MALRIVSIKDKRDNPIELKIFTPQGYSDTWMYVKSEQKRIKERSIDDKISSRFQEELQSLSNGLDKKGTTKKVEKVCERIGRLKDYGNYFSQAINYQLNSLEIVCIIIYYLPRFSNHCNL